MSSESFLFTSESVSMGHPDKLADQISDGILDALLAEDRFSRVACETLVATGMAIIAGEITTSARIDYTDVVRQVIREVGYTSDEMGYNADTCSVMVSLRRQSPDIAMGVDEDPQKGKQLGAGDQGMMFGYACKQTPDLMPLPISLAHRILNKLTQVRKKGKVDWLRPDGKSQVTIEYVNGKPARVDTVVVSAQHAPHVKQKQIREFVIEEVVKPLLPKNMVRGKITYHVNPTGRFVTGGPHGDTGVTGRKIIVDTYGGWARHGGGAFSGKDASKVDRSGAYAARWAAKNVVAAGLARRCEIQLAYAIGVPEPVSIYVETGGTGLVPDQTIARALREVFDFRPRAIIEQLRLDRPIFRPTAAYGHFGRSPYRERRDGLELDFFPWERTDRTAELRAATRA